MSSGTLVAATAPMSNFRLLRLLGEGAMGAVWEAEDTNLGRRVAVKIVTAEQEHRPGPMTARLREEARLSVRVTHPNVVSIFGFDVADAGRPFMVMELLEGRSVAEEVYLHGPLLVDEVSALMTQASSALAAVHAAGILHLDVKPDNLLVVRGPVFQVKLIDFGIAQPTRGSAHDGARTSIDGTPEFMSPEQMGACETLDERSDDFALAVCLYHALTAEMPFVGTTIPDLWLAISRGELTPPSVHRPELRPAVDAFFARALSYEREERFPDTAAMRDAFHAATAQLRPASERPPVAVPHGPSGTALALLEERIPRRRTRRGWIIAVACVVASAVLAGAAYARTDHGRVVPDVSSFEDADVPDAAP